MYYLGVLWPLGKHYQCYSGTEYCVVRSSPLILLEIFSASHSLHSLVIFSTFCCKRQELIFYPVPHIDPNIQPSSPPEQTSLWPGWARRAANAASPGFSRKEGSGEAGLNPNTSPHRFLSGKCVFVYYEGKSEGVAKTMGGDDEK